MPDAERATLSKSGHSICFIFDMTVNAAIPLNIFKTTMLNNIEL